LTTSVKLTEAEVANVTWTVVGIDGHERVSIGKGTHPVTGLPITVRRREFLADAELQTLNAEERNSRDSKRWGAGAGSEKAGNVPLVRVGRIPLGKFYADLASRMREGDKDHLKWWLNRDENQPFRTKSGRL
jgi:hypothetical protein